jgi:long-chain acyl-CoA synthetase
MLLYEWLRDAATSSGGAKALVYRDTYLSWRGLIHRVERRAGEFGAMGIGRGDFVGLMLGNVPDFVILTLALAKLGAVVVPFDPTTSPGELEAVLETAPLRGLITRPRGADAPPVKKPTRGGKSKPAPQPESRRRLQGTLLTCAIYDADKSLTPKPAVAAPRFSKKNAAPSPDELQIIHYTSTSSGSAKGVIRTRGNLEAEVQNIITTLKVVPDDRILAAVPLFLAYGFDMAFLVAMKTGATLYLEDEASPKRVLKLLREQEINFFPGAPALYTPLAKMPTARPLKQKGARFLAAGEPLSDALAEAFHGRLGIRILPHYHTTETGAIAVERKGGPSAIGVGKAFDGVEVLIADAQSGDKMPSGQRGVIWVRSSAVSPGAFGDPSGLAHLNQLDGHREPAGKKNGARKADKVDAVVPIGARDASGWFRTGDLGYVDRAGRLFLQGREDDLVKVDGKRVALSEVERCIRAFPKVAAARAFTHQDPVTGQVVIAQVVVRGACEAEEVLDHCARNLAPYKVPRRIEFLDELAGG